MRSRLKVARILCGYSQRKLGARARVSQQMISLIETRRYQPSPRLRARLGRALGQSTDFIFEAGEPDD